jgi:hypothetical protein
MKELFRWEENNFFFDYEGKMAMEMEESKRLNMRQL